MCTCLLRRFTADLAVPSELSLELNGSGLSDMVQKLVRPGALCMQGIRVTSANIPTVTITATCTLDRQARIWSIQTLSEWCSMASLKNLGGAGRVG